MASHFQRFTGSPRKKEVLDKQRRKNFSALGACFSDGGFVNEETKAIFEWLARFIKTLEDGAIDPEEAQEILLTLSEMAERLKGCLSRRWWRWVCTAAALCFREGAEEIKRKEQETNGD